MESRLSKRDFLYFILHIVDLRDMLTLVLSRLFGNSKGSTNLFCLAPYLNAPWSIQEGLARQ